MTELIVAAAGRVDVTCGPDIKNFNEDNMSTSTYIPNKVYSLHYFFARLFLTHVDDHATA
jgi:hypothetical protein